MDLNEEAIIASGGIVAPLPEPEIMKWVRERARKHGPIGPDLIGLDMIKMYGEEFCKRSLGISIVDGHVRYEFSREPIVYGRPDGFE